MTRLLILLVSSIKDSAASTGPVIWCSTLVVHFFLNKVLLYSSKHAAEVSVHRYLAYCHSRAELDKKEGLSRKVVVNPLDKDEKLMIFRACPVISLTQGNLFDQLSLSIPGNQVRVRILSETPACLTLYSIYRYSIYLYSIYLCPTHFILHTSILYSCILYTCILYSVF